ncbi:class I SAM-dependent methyltransferase [Roseiconus lacunae]|uniref:Class I SAM-dependent methyltransferase n=1 Tax=Roseiconus lacunae TaxID=2605694 RepID=A0ABT7PIF8_9BACT|nr:class I SAM-dependent methyltransferase [Roseiconus lacunae]MDM4016270.1 class I SAM-dependent methyltransferase [Roseiconus lacunae]
MHDTSVSRPNIIEHVPAGQMCCDPIWEAAYARFETPEEEVAKFVRRLKQFGFEGLDRNSKIVEIFCGRGNGLVALERLGFVNVEGVDLSDTLLQQYNGTAQLHLANCLDLPFEDNSYDVVIVQGGLHHLPQMPGDLDQAAGEVKRVLRPEGAFFVIEPWRTPFLTFAHFVTELRVMRSLYPKGDALAVMTEQERVTYEQWLAMPSKIREVFRRHFQEVQWKTRWGKLAGVFRVG